MVRRLALIGSLALVLGLAQAQGTFTYLAGQEIPTIDPAKHTDETSTQGVINLYDPLVFPKTREGLMEPGPHIAESWTASPDGRTFVFKIRKGIKFHDGAELTADDVVFSIQRMMAMKKGFSWLWLGILDPTKNAVANDKNTVTFRLSEPFSPFLSTLTQLFIVNKDLILKNIKPGSFGQLGDYGEAFLNEKEAGSGPFMLVNYERSTVLEMGRFKDYWRGWKAGQVEKVILRVNKEEATMRTLLVSNQVNMIDQWRTPATYEQLAKTQGIEVNERPSAQLFHIPMNTSKPPLNDVRIRRAIVAAFDYDTALKQIFKGAIQARGPVPETAWKAYGVTDKDLDANGINSYKQNLEAAKRDLTAAGVKPGDLTLNYVYPEGGTLQRQVGLLLQSNLQPLGIKLNVQELPWARIIEMSTTAATNPDMAAIFDTLKYPHPDSHTYGMYHPSAWGSYRTISRYSSPVVTAYLERARRASDAKQQLDLYLKATGMVVKDYPSIFVANPVHRIAYRADVNGYKYVGLLGYDTAFYDYIIGK